MRKIFFVLAILVCAFIIYGISQIESESPQGFWKELAEVRADPEYQVEHEQGKQESEKYGAIVTVVVVIFLVVVIGGSELARSKYALQGFVFIIAFLVLGAIFYIFAYGGDTTPSPQIVRVVQPASSAETNLLQAQANETNTRANVNTSLSVALIIIPVAIFMFIVAGISLFLRREDI